MTPTATDLTQILSTVKQQVESYNTERQQLAASLREIVTQANQLLTQLGEVVNVPSGARRRGRPAGTGAKRGRPAGTAKGTGKRGRPKGRKMSAAARKAISDAQKARWAKQKAEKK